jgi:hypothetical protein
MKKLMMIIFLGLVALLLLQVLGCEGMAGKRGIEGDTGEQGDPYAAPVPDNRTFSLAIGNNSPMIHNGAPKLLLAFDNAHANAGDTVVCQRLTGSVVPSIDGIDDSGEWPEKYTDVQLHKLAFKNNKIETARVRSAYDEQYIYFQVKWTEVADSALGLAVNEDLHPSHWLYQDTLPKLDSIWRKEVVGDEDRVMMMFEITPMTWYSHDGCLVTCHSGGATIEAPETNYHSTRNAKSKMDMWSWSSVTSNPAGFADDKYLDGTGQALDPSTVLGYRDGIKGDLGRAPFMANLDLVMRSATTVISRPLYQSISDPDSISTYPFWDWQMTAYTNSSGWRMHFQVPSFITTIPTLSRADIMARGKYDNGTWTVEFKRLRATGNGDDTKF